jgi:hypothetical protein
MDITKEDITEQTDFGAALTFNAQCPSVSINFAHANPTGLEPNTRIAFLAESVTSNSESHFNPTTWPFILG